MRSADVPYQISSQLARARSPVARADIRTVAFPLLVESAGRLGQAAIRQRVSVAVAAPESERGREEPAVAPERPVAAQGDVDSCCAAERTPASGQNVVAWIHAEVVRREEALVGQRFEVVLQWPQGVRVRAGPEPEEGNVLEDQRKGC